MFQLSILRLINWKMVAVVAILMLSSLLTIAGSQAFSHITAQGEISFFIPKVMTQLRWQILGWIVFFLMASFDYNHLREWTWILYIGCLISLVGLFFVNPIANVHRWYRIAFLGMSLQPAEYAKVVVVMAMSWYLEKNKVVSENFSVALGLMGIIAPIFILIIKQPDLGSAIVLVPLMVVLMSFGRVHPWIRKIVVYGSIFAFSLILLIFIGVFDHEQLRPLMTTFMKEYQYERLNPLSYHQLSSQTAISIGSIWGRGLYGGSYSQGGWLPEAITDSIFASWAEMFGLVGVLLIIGLYWILIRQALQASLVAKDSFGQLLAAGLSVYFAIHVLINIGMMCGLLPITGVPLPLMSYGGSAVIANMMALGILQSIYSRRFIF